MSWIFTWLFPPTPTELSLDDILAFVSDTVTAARDGRAPIGNVVLLTVAIGPYALLALIVLRAACGSLASVASTWRRFGVRELRKRLLGAALRAARACIPGVGRLVEAEVRKNLAGIERDMLGEGDDTALVALPSDGKSAVVVAHACDSMRQSDLFVTHGGKKWGGIYHEASSELTALQAKVWAMYNTSNALYPKECACSSAMPRPQSARHQAAARHADARRVARACSGQSRRCARWRPR